MNSEELLKFTRDRLLPAADEIISNSYDAYCKGDDIGVETKSDNTPATNADREAEKALRSMILNHYPHHGIQGEEFGAHNPDSDWIWVLDPLDGTREFLAKAPGNFGILIGLLYKGQTCLGAVSDPVNCKHWLSGISNATGDTNKLENSIVACTNPEGMFETPTLRQGILSVKVKAQEIKTGLNCLGFAMVVDGIFDAAIENNLKAHDLIPLLPVMLNAGISVVDLDGNDYAKMRFDTNDAFTGRYGVVAAMSQSLIDEILDCFPEEVD